MRYKTKIIKKDNKIFDRMQELGISQQTLADKLGCNRSYLANLKAGREVASLEFYQSIKKAIRELEKDLLENT